MEQKKLDSSFATHETIHLHDLILSEINDAGGIAKFISLAIERHKNSNTSSELAQEISPYASNLSQLQRLARFIAIPDPRLQTLGSSERANGFYWGEVIGMEIGDRLFNEQWSIVLYHRLNKFLRTGKKIITLPSDDLQSSPIPDAPSTVNVLGGFDDTTNIANILLALLEDEEDVTPLPNPYNDLGRNWAHELSDKEEVRFFIYSGYKFVINEMLELAAYLATVESAV